MEDFANLAKFERCKFTVLFMSLHIITGQILEKTRLKIENLSKKYVPLCTP